MLEQTELQQIKLDEYTNTGISETYYRDSLIENDNDIKAYQDLNYLEIKVREKIKQLQQISNNNLMMDRLRRLKRRISLQDLRGY